MSVKDKFLAEAIDEAKKGLSEGGIPIGSVLVKNDEIVGRGRNRRVQQGDPMAHAEIDCLRDAGRIGKYAGTVLYSTLQPCFLCSGAVVQFGIRKVVVGESETFAGAPDFLKAHGVDVVNAADAECIGLMRDFIAAKPELWNEDIGK